MDNLVQNMRQHALRPPHAGFGQGTNTKLIRFVGGSG